jgi:hypothetical protein
MKKACIILIALALLALSVPTFAEPPAAGSFHAWNQGNLFPYYKIGSADAVWGWGPQWDSAPGPDQEWTFAYDGTNYGFNGTFEFGGDQFVLGSTNGGQPLSWFGTYYKFGELAKVTIGKPRVSDYTEFSQMEGNNVAARFMDSDWGALLQLFPVTGLSIGAVAYVPNVNAATTTFKVADIGKNFGLAASYAIPNIAKISVDWRTIAFANAGGGAGVPDTPTAVGPTQLLGLGLNVSALKGFGLNAGFQMNMSNLNTPTKLFVSASTGMIAPISIALDFALAKAANTFYAVEGDVSLPLMNSWSVGARIGYDTGVGWFNQGVGDWNGFELWPYITKAFDNGSSFKVGFVYASGSTATGATKLAVTAVPVIYVWAF